MPVTDEGCSRWLCLMVVLATGCAGDDHDRTGVPWDPEASASGSSSSGTGGSDAADSSTGADPGCDPGETQECLCPDGLHLGEETCSADGTGFGPCACDGEGSTTSGSTSEGGEETTGDGETDEVCYPGADNAWTTCVPLVHFEPPPEGYAYPAPYQGDPNYRKPIAFIDLEALDPAMKLAPNFELGEIAQSSKGRYAIVQPHAVASLQELRDAVGAIGVNSGYRSPAYNVQIGGATYSRHMYGDGFDMDPLEVGLDTLEAQCTGKGGMLVEYTTHVHCDFRFDPVDEEFYGPEPMGIAADPGLKATLQTSEGVISAPVDGFDEGEPVRRWIAYDGEGKVLSTGEGSEFVPPPGAARVEVDVGRVIELQLDL